jgi:hypothetical protein
MAGRAAGSTPPVEVAAAEAPDLADEATDVALCLKLDSAARMLLKAEPVALARALLKLASSEERRALADD